jgi:ferric-dicitrate binding protein FerR (iron transport regulator)
VAEEMEKRQDRLEWEVGVLKERYDHMDDRIGEMSMRMDQQHRELLAAIDSLKDDRARAEGVEAAERKVAQRDRDRMRAMGIVIAILGLMAAIGWVGSKDAGAHTVPPGERRYEERDFADP